MDPVKRALLEDGAFRDVTSAIIPNTRVRGRFLAKADLVVCGMELARRTFRLVGVSFSPRVKDGARVRKGQTMATVSGPARRVLAGERTALNFVQQLSGVATITRKFVDLAKPVRVFDTRKTTPGLRDLEKDAVRCGGGHNHRFGLHDGVMIKDNHIAAIGDLEVLREKVDLLASKGRPIVLEAATHDQALLFATFPITVLMLDNFDVAGLRRAVKAVRRLNPGLEIEASGGVNLKTVRDIARTGVDRVSVGALTHSAPAVDISLEL
ncbi:MAG TPA: carboxylating nicotinate-nucleotide diphosphorylase [Planctomycetota bacterium]|nr:carboxylating nicotinate-nucleotide diphosphorylase [Planctomycetota bacterium]